MTSKTALSATVECPDGYQVVNGGYDIGGTDAATIVGSYPSGNGWGVTFYVPYNGFDREIYVGAICCAPPVVRRR